jgi:uncharacterized protein YcbX
MHLSGLYLYPVKSLRGVSVTSAQIDELGFVGDRRFLIIDEYGRFLTQRTLPRMAQIKTALSADAVTVSADGAGNFSVSRAADARAAVRSVSVWGSEGLLAEDCGDLPARWLSDLLSTKCRMVRIGEKFRRPILKPDVAGPGDLVNFADAFPFLVISEASLADLNDRLVANGADRLPMNRFRPNLVVTGCDAYAEDTWTRFRIGPVVFRTGGPCIRCPITTTDQETAARGKEPLRTLAGYRRHAANPTDVKFGQNVLHEIKSGTLRVGDEVQLE